MSIFHRKGAWFIRSIKLLRLIRTLSTLTEVNDMPITLSTSSLSLRLESYRREKDTEVVYHKNRTIDGLIKIGQLNSALKVFNAMPLCDVVTYNLLISGHRRFGLSEQAFQFYAEMVSLGIRESASTFSSILGICTDAGFLKEGIQVHCRAVSLGYSSNLFVGSSLVNFYLHMGIENVALKLFDELQGQSLAAWNALLGWFCEVGQVDKLLRLYYRMKQDGVESNGLTFSYLIRGCCNGGFLNEGKQVHCHALKIGWVELNIFVSNGLVDLYSNCGSLIDASRAFEAIPQEDVISWNSITWVYADSGMLPDALELFTEMQLWGKRPSIHSIVGFLNLASETKNIEFGKQVHSFAVKLGFDNDSVHIQSALIDMYGKCGEIEKSMAIYENIQEKTLVCCNSLMTSLFHCGAIGDVIEMFGFMVDEGFGLDEVTLSTSLKALSVSSLASLTSFKLLHSFAVKQGLGSDIAVSCSLMDSYSRCGYMDLSLQIFGDIPSPNIRCFTSIINGYSQNGMGKEALNMFGAMIQKDLKPDKVALLCVLTGCNHAGLIKEGKLLFDSMETLYGISPERQHFSCMVDLLGRAGFIEEAEGLLQKAPVREDSTMWSSLLRSCRVHKNEVLGRRAAKTLLQLEPENPAIRLQVSNFYSEIGDFENSIQINGLAMGRKVTKEIGHSLIELSSHL